MAEVAHQQDGIIELTIANGASVASQAFSLDGRKLVGIITPAGWTTAVLTFKAGPDANRLFNVYDAAVERAIADAALQNASAYLAQDQKLWEGMGLILLRSGTAASPVNQGAARTVRIIVGAAQ